MQQIQHFRRISKNWPHRVRHNGKTPQVVKSTPNGHLHNVRHIQMAVGTSVVNSHPTFEEYSSLEHANARSQLHDPETAEMCSLTKRLA